jgi:ribose transport system substrate-binding protein
MVCACALAVSGCAQGEEKAQGSAAGGDSACNLDYVKGQIAKHKAIPDWTPPGPAFDAEKAAGKTLYTIQENTANPFSATIVEGINEVA